MKNRFEKFARIFSSRHKQTTFSDVGFLGALRVKSFVRLFFFFFFLFFFFFFFSFFFFFFFLLSFFIDLFSEWSLHNIVTALSPLKVY